jgi:GTP-binding protein LepA
LNDASLVYEPENSQALNFGFRAGFLVYSYGDCPGAVGREYDMDILVTAPSVEYRF